MYSVTTLWQAEQICRKIALLYIVPCSFAREIALLRNKQNKIAVRLHYFQTSGAILL